MTKIEQVARGQADFDGRGWMAMSKVDRDRYMQRARLAIEAMRVPTPKMLEAGDSGLAASGVDDPTTEDADECWRAMIDAALAEDQ